MTVEFHVTKLRRQSSYRHACGSTTEVDRHAKPAAQRACANKEVDMKIVVIGGTGLIGAKTVKSPRAGPRGRRRVADDAASTPSPVKAWRKRSRGAQVVVDVANSPSFEDAAVLEFFADLRPQPARCRSGGGVPSRRAVRRRHRALPESGYFRAKMAQEKLIEVRDSLHDRALDAVLRIPRRHRPVGDRGRTRFGCPGVRADRRVRRRAPRLPISQ